MPLAPELQVLVRNAVERWLARNADAEQASMTITITTDGITLDTHQQHRLRPPPATG